MGFRVIPDPVLSVLNPMLSKLNLKKPPQGAGPLSGFIGLFAHCSFVALVYEHSAVLILLVAEEKEENDF